MSLGRGQNCFDFDDPLPAISLVLLADGKLYYKGALHVFEVSLYS